MSNHLKNENSPYLLQHADNPVDWYPWGDEALKKAREENKPIFLSIGYSACHWCHVMEKESFSNQSTADLLNQSFIAIKVDREERPDLDHIYMQAVTAMTGQGGWPMNTFLTPEGKPFWGGTYFPPVQRYNLPSFNDILTGIAEAWQSDREKLIQAGQSLTDQVYAPPIIPTKTAVLSTKAVKDAVAQISQDYDWKSGGWGQAPKFPHPIRINFLLQRAAQGDQSALKMAEHALQTMAQGGLFDVVGGGFARYSTDVRWLIPHFEKMLYDNAMLTLAYLYAYKITNNPLYHTVVESTLAFLLREMQLPDGGFISAIDADSEGQEGKFYVWSSDEIDQVLTDPDENYFLRVIYHVSMQGNFEGKNILQRVRSNAEAAQLLHLSEKEVQLKLEEIHKKLLSVRDQRIHPHQDDKVLTAWNAMMLLTLSEAARYLQDETYLAAAQKNAEFIVNELFPAEGLKRSWRNGQTRHDAFLEDYGSLIQALLSLYQTDSNNRWYASARALTEEMLTLFYQAEDGFFDTRLDGEKLITRPQNNQDNATPAGASQAVRALALLSAFEANSKWDEIVERELIRMHDLIANYPTVFSNWLSAYDFVMQPTKEIALVGTSQDPLASKFQKVIWEEYDPLRIVAAGTETESNSVPALLKNRPAVKGKPTAYVCKNHACQQPVTTIKELKARIER